MVTSRGTDDLGDAARLDRLTLEAIYRAEAPRLTMYVRRHLIAGQDALDLVHDAFVRLATSRPGEGHHHPGAYLRRIARNLLLDRIRQRQSRNGLTAAVEDGPDITVPPDQADAIQAAETLEAFRRALSELPERTRQVFILHRVDDLPYREIADRMGISIPTVQYHIARSLSHIDKALDRE